jgi:HSP20 family molecular chaperone IbpA
LKVRLNRSLDPGRITATMNNGVLRMTVSKREEAQPRRISVN